jgi:hypothetical protein
LCTVVRTGLQPAGANATLQTLPIMKTFSLCLIATLFTAARVAAAQNLPIEDQVKQLLEETPSASNNNVGPTGIIPVQRGFNLSLLSASQHDSGAGWSTILTPNLAYRFNQHFSANVSAPIFLYVLTNTTGGTPERPTMVQKVSHGIAGDTSLAGHLDLQLFDRAFYTLTGTLSLPSGNNSLGLGSGQVTYDFNNHFEADLPLDPFVEVGIGDSSALVNGRIRRGQNSVGLVGHFELGGGINLPHAMYFSASAYEILPISTQTVTSTRTVRGRTNPSVTGSSGLAEDNGFNTSLDIPVQSHVTLSGFYNRSLRQHDDTVGFSFTFLARARTKPM